ncbi:hypothetical protein GGI25_000861 [Coemansia spiralis]|uniref:Uncharacterized protein n=2 Tax=Coemansia TaxID=4863 RepID=A0A9W8G6S2_9FUNG|nr:hypothetical protein EDC05_001772 [Coemansia umbellata]KAJ2623598.1 hypothetical protein GGI26_002236 [Coemansia sp. RSA 1358]KAJ2680268.1 hypothetical protein GGI25_000861 [Coemansia spiralis]
MVDESTEPSESVAGVATTATTPLSMSFRDAEFEKFVNEVDIRNTRYSPYRANPISARQPRQKDSNTPHSNRSRSDSEGAATSQERTDTVAKFVDKKQYATGRAASFAESGNVPSLGTNPYDSANDRNDADGIADVWDELDNMELDSQTMRQLEETEEQFYATQQFIDLTDIALSQDFAESKDYQIPANGRNSIARCTSAGGDGAHGTRTVHMQATRSVPVTPTIAQPIYTPDNGSSGHPSTEKRLLHESSISEAISHSSSAKNTHQQPHYSGSNHIGASSSSSSRGKVNLYQRLVQHIPFRPGNSSSAQGLPPVGYQSTNSSSTQQPQPKRYKPESLSISSPNASIDLGTSILTPASSKPKQCDSTQASPSHRLSSSTLPASPNIQARSDSTSLTEEVERLRIENERMRTETEQLKVQLYTKEGEVRIVRENLARTEINNTHLQEQLANQISNSATEQKLAEKKLQGEIERLKTELFFQQQEAQVAAISVNGNQTPHAAGSTPRLAQRSHVEKENTNDAQINSKTVDGYPSVQDFSSTPKMQSLTSKTIYEAMSSDSPTPYGTTQQSKSYKDASLQAKSQNSLAYETNIVLFEILQTIADQSSMGFSSLVALSIQLSNAIREPSREQINAFQSSACDTISKLALDKSYSQLTAVLMLLLRILSTLNGFCTMWILDSKLPETTASIQDDAAMASVGSGQHRISQLCTVLRSSLQDSIQVASKMRSESSESTDCGMAVSLQSKLLARIISLQPAAALNDKAWSEFNLCLEIEPFLTPSFDLNALLGILELVTTLVRVSTAAWGFIHSAPREFEKLLLAIVRRLRIAFTEGNSLVLEGERSLLVLIASAIVTHEDDTPLIINAMKRFTVALVQWFIDEHKILTSKHLAANATRRLQVFFEYAKCLNVVLSEVDDVAELLGGDNSPLFYSFVAACTRMSIGESAFAGLTSMRDLAADLLAYVVTEEQALSIQNLVLE